MSFIAKKLAKYLKPMLGLMLFALLLSGCNTPSEAAPSSSQASDPASSEPSDEKITFTVGQAGDIQYLNPFLTTDARSGQVIGMISEGLVGYEGNYKLVPKLATSLGEYSDDGMTLTFPLRQGVKFHDGSDFTAEDVKFTYDSILDPDQKSNQRTQFNQFIEEVIVEDEYTVVFKFKQPYGPALHRLTMQILSKTYVQENGYDKNGYEGYSNAAVGTGPYKLVEWQPDVHVLLAANEDYWGGVPEVDEVRIRPIAENSVRLMAFEAGEIDFIFSVTPEEVESLKAKDDFNVFSFPQYRIAYMTWNTQTELFQDLALRQALTYATDKDSIVSAVLEGNALKAVSAYSPKSEYFNEAIGEPYPYDPAKAIQTLEDAGYTKGEDGIFMNPNGLRCSFKTTVMSNNNPVVDEAIAQYLEQWFKAVGVEMIIVKQTSQELYDTMDAVIAGTLPEDSYVSMIGSMGTGVDPDMTRYFHSEGGLNDFRYKNADIDALMEEGSQLITFEDRKPVYDEIQEIMANDLPCLFLYFPDSVNAVNAKYEGMDETPYGQLYNMLNVHVK